MYQNSVLNPANSTAMPDPNAATQAVAFGDASNTTQAASNTTASNSSVTSTTRRAGAIKAIETGMSGPMGTAGMAALFGMVAVAGL